MKKLLLVFTTVIFTSCSFDNKTGIWKDASSISVDDQGTKSISNDQQEIKYEDIFTKDKFFNEEKEPDNSLAIKINDPIKIINWSEQYAISSNNISNFFYTGNNTRISRSSRLSKLSSNKSNKIVFYKDNFISHDHKGNIFIFSLSLNKKVFKYNFYKKNFKKYNKKINFVIDKNILYSADNLGYLYAINLDDKSILWAKNYGIPFRSNMKFVDGQILLANQDNVVYSINSSTGKTNWTFATSQTILKSDFENNLALDTINNNLFFLNTSGELYSISYLSKKINWVLNFKNSSLGGDAELFLSHPVVTKNNNLIVATEKTILSYDNSTAERKWKIPAESIFKPIITSKYTFVILKNDLLVCLDNENSKIIWSKNIFRNIKNNKIKNKFGSIIDFKIVNNKINIYSTNGYLLTYNLNNGNLNSSNKISKKGIASEVFFLDANMLFVDTAYKLLKFN